MVRLARAVLIVIGIAAALLCAAMLVRLVVLRADPSVVWPLPSWWSWLISPDHPVRSGVAAAVCGFAALVCLWLAATVVRRRNPAVRRLDLVVDAKGDTAVEAGAIDRLLAGGIERSVPEVVGARAHLFHARTGYDAAVAVTVRPCDVAALHARVLAVVRADLLKTTGTTISGLELEVDRFVLEDRGVS